VIYVQNSHSTPQGQVASVKAAYAAAQALGDANIVVVGWNDSTATINSVKDTTGNTYTLAVGPTVQTGVATQAIYYATSIAAAGAGANTVTVTFNGNATSPDLRILEYAGVNVANPIDGTGAATGTTTTSTASLTTTNANDLIFAADLVQTLTTGPGAGFTSRVITSPDGDIAEDELVTTTGVHTATAPVAPAGGWIMQAVALRAANASIPPPLPTPVTYVQNAYSTPQGKVGTVKATFAKAQTQGDLNLVAIGWNDSTATISSLVDTAGNTYTLAVGPTVQNGLATQAIYYAKNIVASSANSVTVTFNGTASSPDLRILEYANADPTNPVESGNGAAGISATSTVSLATISAADLIFAANLVQTFTTGSGAGFVSRVITQPDGDIAEDMVVGAAGTYTATAPVSPPGGWIMQAIGIKHK
jgi:hypothetical protein